MLMQGDVDWVPLLGAAAAILAALSAVLIFLLSRVGAAYATAASERDLAEKTARAHETRLFQILSAIPVALVETDLSGRFVFANRAAHQLLGRRDAELLGLRFHSATWGITYPDGRLIPPDLLPSARALRGQTVKGFQHVIANPGTRKRMLVSVTAMPILNGVGEVVGSTAALVEIESLAASPEAQDMTRRVFDAASSMLLVVGADGRIRDANRTATEALAPAGRDLVGREAVDLAAPEARRDVVKALLDRVFATGERTIDPVEEAVTLADGERRFVRWTATPLAGGAEGAADAVLLVGEDVTDADQAPAATAVEIGPDPQLLVAAQAQLAQATARAEAAERALDEARRSAEMARAAGDTAQDFNGLLSVMVGALDMIARQPEPVERTARLAAAALAAGRKGERMSRQLAAFGRGDPVDLPTLDVAQTLAAMPARLDHGRVEVSLAADRLLVRSDPVALEAALAALVDNARQAQGPEGPIRVRVTAESADDRAWVQISVADQGPGFADDVLARATEPFFTTRPGATGLGLSQALGFARAVDGELILANGPEGGAVVTLRLPRLSEPEPQAHPESAALAR